MQKSKPKKNHREKDRRGKIEEFRLRYINIARVRYVLLIYYPKTLILGVPDWDEVED